ncbi:glycosyl transferase family 2 [Sinisalibacter aestuarii]|uniref:Chitooligosaccharide deacetylase n=1 Tax=Sinisalibacter aestuarii TaxID=2949426 RepID=A0ABQ5LVC1_9RHOB|nr:glycosyl transferase family 2 [Sinisalibacter aestuarii]
MSAALTWLAFFLASLYLVDDLPGPVLAHAAEDVPASVSAAPQPGDLRGGIVPEGRGGPYPPLAAQADAENVVELPTGSVWAFLPFVPESAYASLASGARQIDVLLAEWYRLDGPQSELVALNRTTESQEYAARTIARERPRLQVMPVVTILPGALPAPDDGAGLETLALHLADTAARDRAAGLCLMPDGIGAGEIAVLGRLIARLDAALATAGRESCLVTEPADGLIADADFARLADHVVLKTFSTPWIGDATGPLAAQGWFDETVAAALEAVGRDRLVVMLGSFAGDWSRGAAAPEILSLAEAWRRVVQFDGTLDFPPDAANLRMRYTDQSGAAHEVWALDAASAFNQLATLAALDLHRVGLWALGREDPSIWPLLGARYVTPELVATYISRVDLSDFVAYMGQGPFQELAAAAQVGTRYVVLDPSGQRIAGEGFAPPATPVTLRRFGRVEPDQIVLTFDDGPDPVHTAALLDVLRDREAPATFFVVGAGALSHPDLIQRMYDEGHEIGSHTFLHPALDGVPPLRTQFELNAVQRLLAAQIGHGTVLFRNPYGRGEGPVTGDSAAPMATLTDAGYLIVGSDLVPPDWLGLDAAGIVDYVSHELATNGGNVIVMHDGGGDRSATVDAVGPLIDRLRADGYRIVGLADLLGVTRDQLMPPAFGPATMFDRISFGLLGIAGGWLAAVFWVVVVAGLLRALVLLALAHLRRPHRAPRPGAGTVPPVTVLIPAFNEEETILRCIGSVFASDYPDLRVIVIDDGSTDHTYQKVAEVARDEYRLTVIYEPNGGKWKALDTAYRVLQTDIVVAIDADSMIAPDAISRLVRHFDDPKIGAVAGRVQVGNRRGLLTQLQALEYLTAQNIDRRALECLGAMLVVPGAIGAWRADAVIAAGLYSPETVTEDADLTVSVLRAGYRVIYEPAAYAVTEAPETVRAFLTQRLRWTFGMLQTAVKHLGGALRQRKAVGFVALPDLLVVGFGLSVLAPIADLVLLSTLADLGIDWLLGRPMPVVDVRPYMLAGYALLPLMDVVAILLAMRLDRSAPLWLVVLFPVQRFFYRQLLYVTVWRALGRAAFGRLASWGKLARTGTARLPGRHKSPAE